MSCYKEGKEIISTEDMIARVEIMNDRNKGWSSTSYWGDMVMEDYRSCLVFEGCEGYNLDEEAPEVCTCEGTMVFMRRGGL